MFVDHRSGDRWMGVKTVLKDCLAQSNTQYPSKHQVFVSLNSEQNFLDLSDFTHFGRSLTLQ
jgi:hypothetical protein